MKKITLFFALMAAVSFSKAQGLDGIIVEKYYLSDAADAANATNNGAASPLNVGSVTYRVFVDMAPGYKFVQMFGNQDALGNVLHPLIFKTTTNFYNDPNNGQIFPQSNSLNNTKKNTTLIDSWLSVGGVCAAKMGVPKNEDTDGSIGNTQGILANNAGGAYAPPINGSGAQDGLATGSPLTPNALGLGNSTDVFDQTPGGTFSVTNGAIAGLGGVVGTTTTNAVLIGQFTTDGVFSFSLNVQISNTVTNVAEVYVPSNPSASETAVPALGYSSAGTGTATGLQVINATGDQTLLSVYPNPTKGMFTISAINVKENAANAYSVYDATGKLVLSKSFEKASGNIAESIDMTGFYSGLYFVNINLNGTVSTRKVVKE